MKKSKKFQKKRKLRDLRLLRKRYLQRNLKLKQPRLKKSPLRIMFLKWKRNLQQKKLKKTNPQQKKIL